MKKILVTGGTVFVSKYVAGYFRDNGYEVYVLNRNTKPQLENVKLIEADRHSIGDKLKNIHFDLVLDVTAYNEGDIADFVTALNSFDTYIMISSSAVYPETGVQPFKEQSEMAENKFWGQYGTDKIAAEKKLLELVPDAYILRPPYLYGPMNNVYREAFVFECAMKDRPFYLPKDGEMKMQFLHVKDLCRFIEWILEKKPQNHIFNVGNKDSVSIKEWVDLCYEVVGKTPAYVKVYDDIEQRLYFSFYNYEYYLDVQNQYEIMPSTIDLKEGLREAFEWYKDNADQVNTKPYFEFIEKNFSDTSGILGSNK
ncbi:MAG: NAD-dependent epimerase/dehydratase family protein [Agathobacter sp.]|nr:NAD-dependent epimerase/dehydratase family protein [Agathobacter sp.]